TIVINALVVGTYLPLVLGLDMPLWLSWAYIAAGETVAAAGLGLPLLFYLRSRPDLVALLRGRPG
ncbi:MAG TPA: QueT transporter family protein, partial [Clostridiales bacterium]|nr:QueT transporter family protein [Clostridiales bacterium]